jgi:hypothetical protein
MLLQKSMKGQGTNTKLTRAQPSVPVLGVQTHAVPRNYEQALKNTKNSKAVAWAALQS